MLNKIQVPEEEIIKWRRQIHENPELSFKEYETAQYIEDLLKSFGIEEVSRPTETSVLAVIRGEKAGRTVMFRADIDALPVLEETGLPYASKNKGVMHACGHDTHTAMLLGTAKVLAGMKNEINGTVKLIFQHAEEFIPGGAKGIVEAGIMEDVDAAFAIHIMPLIKTGAIGLVSGTVSTAADMFNLKIQGLGAHASMPENSIDPIMVGSQLVMALNTIVSRNVPPKEMAVLSIGEFHAGSAANIIPDSAKLSGSIRTTSKEIRILMEKRIKEVIDHICKANNATYDLEYTLGYAAVVNDAELVDFARNSVIKANGEDMVVTGSMVMGSEDFSAYTDVKKGCFMVLGGGKAEDGYKYTNHHPKFIIDEAALAYGTRAEIQIILDYLNN